MCENGLFVEQKYANFGLRDGDGQLKREALLRELKAYARKREKPIEVFTDKRKGSHYRVSFDEKMTTIKSGELTPGYVRLIKKQLGIE